MKVLIVNQSEQTGGAAVAANRLHHALLAAGVESRLMVVRRLTDSRHVVTVGHPLTTRWRFVWERAVIWLNNCLSRKNLFKVSVANTGVDITRTPEFREADIVHLHWVNFGMLSLRGIERVLSSGKTVVWTMHDMWPFTAICHYSHGCTRFATGCSHCKFLLLPGKHDLSARVWKKKLAIFPRHRATYVAVSNWLAQEARKSRVLEGQRVEVIPNVLSLQRFTITPRQEARRLLNLTTRYVVAFGAACIDDPIKGLNQLESALHHLLNTGQMAREDLTLVLFGGAHQPDQLASMRVPYTYMGFQSTEAQLSLIYSAANCVVSSSLYETFGQTLIEALACGSIPVAYDSGGQTDIVRHLQNGYLAPALDFCALANGILWACQSNLTPERQRADAVARYGQDVVAAQYLSLYRQLLTPSSSDA